MNAADSASSTGPQATVATTRHPEPGILFALVVLAIGAGIGLSLLLTVWQVDDQGVSRISGRLPVVDFSNLWNGGRLVRSGRIDVLFDPEAYTAWFRAAFSPRLIPIEWTYPPSLLLLAVPISTLPLYVAYAAWSVGTILLLLLAMRAGGLSRWVCLAVALSPGIFENLRFGQYAALSAALLVGGMLALLRGRPIAAGVLMGLLTFKPQLGLLLPVCVLARGQWRTAAVAGVTAGGMVMASGALFGWECWAVYLHKTQPWVRHVVLEAPWPGLRNYNINAVTPFALARAVGCALSLAYGLQALLALACGVVTWRAWRLPDTSPGLLTGMTVCLTFLATPYAMSYDLPAFSVALAILAETVGWRVSVAVAVAWLWPNLNLALVHWIGVPIAPLIILFVAAAIAPRLRRPTVPMTAGS